MNVPVKKNKIEPPEETSISNDQCSYLYLVDDNDNHMNTKYGHGSPILSVKLESHENIDIKEESLDPVFNVDRKWEKSENLCALQECQPDKTVQNWKRIIMSRPTFQIGQLDEDQEVITSGKNLTYKVLNVHKPKYNLEKHQMSCDLCSFKTSVKSSMENHLFVHGDKKWFACELCSYKGRWSSAVQRHINNMHGLFLPLSCKYCSFKTRLKRRLQTHVNTFHTSKGPFSCQRCSYVTTVKSHYKAHLLTHSKDKYLSCRFCPFQTVLGVHNLHGHIINNHPGVPYSLALSMTAQSSRKGLSLRDSNI